MGFPVRTTKPSKWAGSMERCRVPVSRACRAIGRPADARHAVSFFGGDRGGPAHFLDLRSAKGRFCSMRAIFSRSSLIPMACSPIFSRRRPTSTDSLTRCGFRPASPASRKVSRHCVSVAAVTPMSRLTRSMSSQRRSLRTTWTLCFAQKRLGVPPSIPIRHLLDDLHSRLSWYPRKPYADPRATNGLRNRHSPRTASEGERTIPT